MKQSLTQFKIKTWCILLLMVLSFSACQKDALIIDSEKTYDEVMATPPTDPMFGGYRLTLKPNGKAGFAPGGDIVWAATYDISGKTITVKIPDMNEKFKFTVISEEELRGPNGQVLKLSHN